MRAKFKSFNIFNTSIQNTLARFLYDIFHTENRSVRRKKNNIGKTRQYVLNKFYSFIIIIYLIISRGLNGEIDEQVSSLYSCVCV